MMTPEERAARRAEKQRRAAEDAEASVARLERRAQSIKDSFDEDDIADEGDPAAWAKAVRASLKVDRSNPPGGTMVNVEHTEIFQEVVAPEVVVQETLSDVDLLLAQMEADRKGKRKLNVRPIATEDLCLDERLDAIMERYTERQEAIDEGRVSRSSRTITPGRTSGVRSRTRTGSGIARLAPQP